MDSITIIASIVAGASIVAAVLAIIFVRRSAARIAEAEKLAVTSAIGELRAQFAELAAEKLRQSSGELSALSRSGLDAVVRPLREQLERLRTAEAKAESDRANLGKTISDNIGKIGEIAGELSKTASALTSDNRVQGRRGEEILADKLRQAGLEEGVTFFLQEGTSSDRPDAQVRNDGNQWIIIDSKVSLTSYMDYATAENDKVREEKLKAHVKSVRDKISDLAGKNYPAKMSEEFFGRNYLPVTVMFMPYEAPLSVALEACPSLVQEALERNVVLLTPLTLLAYLRLVRLTWQRECEDANRRDIADAASELLNRVNNFVIYFDEVGKKLEAVKKEYDNAKKLMIDVGGGHSIVKSANKLIDLNVKFENRKGQKKELAASIAADRSMEEEQP